MKRVSIILLIVFASQSGFVNKSDSEDIPLSKIPYNSTMAREDISKGIIRIIDLISPTYEAERTRLQDLIDDHDLTLVEEQVGFSFEDIIMDDIAPKYLTQREDEYNAVVYQYLDSKHNTPSKSMIQGLILEIYKKQKAKENL